MFLLVPFRSLKNFNFENNKKFNFDSKFNWRQWFVALCCVYVESKKLFETS